VNAHTKLFKLNRSQAVRLPKSVAFPEGVEEVIVRRVGKSVIITPADALWDDFFDMLPSPDFPEPEDLPVQERDLSWP
jgi:antitoxin VapB